MEPDIAQRTRAILAAYDSHAPHLGADELRQLWLQFEPKSVAGIKAEQREQQETMGIPIPVLKLIGQEVAKVARRRVADLIPLTRLLWDRYGREGRVVALIALGAMERAEPDTIVPLLMELCRTCVTWEDCDRLAMDALEPVVRKNPQEWLGTMEPWLVDENRWVRRAGVTVVARLPMKHPAYTARCLEMIEPLLAEEDTDVKKALSFAIRLAARGEVVPVCDFLRAHVPPHIPAATWVLCDAIRSMTNKLLPQFRSLLPLYERWAANPALSARDRRSVESAIEVLRGVSG